MVKYSCEKCGKEFTQKGHYTKHTTKKNPCVFESKIEEIIEKIISKKLMNIVYDEKCNTEEPQQTEIKIVCEEGLDKFYTIPTCSKKCIDKICELYDIKKWDLIVEPSAGNGSFLNQIPSNNKIGIDISPEQPNIIKQDFFDYSPPSNKTNILVIGNPPFGRVSSLAIKFFNYSATWANVIAFIIPRTFRKISVQNKLDNMFHLVYDEEISNNPCCFSPQMMVKCCFQIWEKKKTKRQVIDLPTTHTDWEFLKLGPNDTNGQPTPPTTADFAMRAYGGNIGEIRTDGLNELRPKSWHWFVSKIDTNILIDGFNKLDYSNSLNTARQNSMGKAELVALYSDFLNSKM
jgi:hypothetical protein